MIGTDKPVLPKFGFHKSLIQNVWEQLHDPERSQGVEVLVVFRILDPVSQRILHYQHSFCPAARLVSAAETDIDGFFVNLRGIAKRLEANETVD
jgi:hypothetical protein